MARSYKPKTPYNVPMILLIPSETMVKGTLKKTFPDPNEVISDCLFYGSFRTFGGTEQIENGVYSVIDTATIETWFRPDIKSNCRVYLPDTGETYEVLGKPENIELRNQYLMFRVQRITGGV